MADEHSMKMSKTKAFLIILGVLAVLFMTYGSLSLGLNQTGLKETSYSFEKSYRHSTKPTGFVTYRKFAIITPSATDGHLQLLQADIAENLRDSLSAADIVRIVPKGKMPFHKRANHDYVMDYPVYRPTVILCRNEAEAVKEHAELLIFVKAEKWECPLLPVVSRNYTASVSFEARPPSGQPTPTGDQGYFYYGLHTTPSVSGRRIGIFTTSFLINKTAKTISDEASRTLIDQVTQGLHEWFEEERERVQKKDPNSSTGEIFIPGY